MSLSVFVAVPSVVPEERPVEIGSLFDPLSAYISHGNIVFTRGRSSGIAVGISFISRSVLGSRGWTATSTTHRIVREMTPPEVVPNPEQQKHHPAK